MKVNIEFHDNTAFTADEIVKQAKRVHGANANVKVSPDSTTPHDLILFALQQMITTTQIGYYYNEGSLYPQKLKELRASTMYKLEELLNEVIMDNETKVE